MAFAHPPFRQLIEIAQDHRDTDWESQFFREFPKEKVRVLYPEPRPGPDGWPYLMIQSGEGGDEPVAQILEWLSARGIGLALNPNKAAPDYVFTYGMIWNYKERREFISRSEEKKPGEFRLMPGSQVLTGPPSESYLPRYARAVLKQFFLDQGLMAPKVLLVSEDRTNYDLCFSIESLGSPPAKEHMGIAEAIAWFLPAHYSIALISENAVPGFEVL